MKVRRKYMGLGIVAILFELIAWLALIASVAFAVWFWFQSFSVRVMDFAPFTAPHWIGFLALPIGIAIFLQCYVLSKALSVLIDIEFNTRANATVSMDLVKAIKALRAPEVSSSVSAARTAPPPPPPPPPVDASEPAPATLSQVTESMAPPPPPPPPEPESESIAEQ